MKVFVTGATGFVGRYILEELIANGHTPMALVRPGSERKLLSFEGSKPLEGIRLIPGDVNQPGQYIHALAEADAIIHLVGIIRQFPSSGITFERMHCHATRNIIAAAARAGVRRFIHMSANGASYNGVCEYMITKWRAEEMVKHSTLEWTVFRPSIIFGASGGLPEFTSQLADVIRWGPLVPLFGGGERKSDPVAVQDVARCFVAALEMDRTIGRTFCLGGGNPVSFAEITQVIGRALGKTRTRTVSVPFWAMAPVARAMEDFAFFPITEDQLKMLAQDNVCARLDYMDAFDITPIPFSAKNLEYLGKR